MAAMEESERMDFEQRKLARQAEKLERRLKKTADPVQRRVEEPPAADLPEPRIIDATGPQEKRPSLAEIESGRKKKGESKPSLAGLRLENYQLPPLDLLEHPLTRRAVARPIMTNCAPFRRSSSRRSLILESRPMRAISRAGRRLRASKSIRTVGCVWIGSRVSSGISRVQRAPSRSIFLRRFLARTLWASRSRTRARSVALRELLETSEWLHSGARLPLGLGKDVYGQTIIADLAKMPHCLVAGTTGSGKSVCINSIIASLLFRFTPEELRFIMIDPKVVEMQIYNELPHLVTPVVTDPKKVLLALRWVVDEMELRYQIFAKSAVRNITGFNERPLPKSQKELDAEKITEGDGPENADEIRRRRTVPKTMRVRRPCHVMKILSFRIECHILL
jgi:S-DNA-T family DNA segregation ATPase FtsK/SpoIIIE